MPSKIIAVLSLLLAGFAHADPLWTWQAKNCLLTKVYLSDQTLNAEFTGHWTTSVAGVTFAPTDRNGVVFIRDVKSPDADWKKLAALFQSQRNHRVTLMITTHSAWAMRGGIPIFFHISPDAVTLTPTLPHP